MCAVAWRLKSLKNTEMKGGKGHGAWVGRREAYKLELESNSSKASLTIGFAMQNYYLCLVFSLGSADTASYKSTADTHADTAVDTQQQMRSAIAHLHVNRKFQEN